MECHFNILGSRFLLGCRHLSIDRWFKFEQMEVYSFYRNICEIMHYAGMVSFMTINHAQVNLKMVTQRHVEDFMFFKWGILIIVLTASLNQNSFNFNIWKKEFRESWYFLLKCHRGIFLNIFWNKTIIPLNLGTLC